MYSWFFTPTLDSFSRKKRTAVPQFPRVGQRSFAHHNQRRRGEKQAHQSQQAPDDTSSTQSDKPQESPRRSPQEFPQLSDIRLKRVDTPSFNNKTFPPLLFSPSTCLFSGLLVQPPVSSPPNLPRPPSDNCSRNDLHAWLSTL